MREFINQTFRFTVKVAVVFLLLLSILATLLVSAGASGTSPNAAPIAKSLEYTTYKDVAVTGECSAVDPEGDKITFAVSKDPEKGSVKIESDGKFVYTPQSGKKGKDSFNYVAIDSNGNISANATVTIIITSLTCNVSYADMEGNDAHYAALLLAENDIFTGAKIGDEYYFQPDLPVTRGEFLVMCLNMCGIEKLDDITKTGFSDDQEIASWLKPYVAAGLMNGVVKGYSNNGVSVFSSDNNITLAEAVVTLDNALAITDVNAESITSAVCPTWALQSAANLQACNIISENSVYNSEITRANAAKLLAGAIDVLNAR